MRNPDRRFYTFPLRAGLSGMFLGFCLTALIMLFSNDTITLLGLMHVLVTLGLGIACVMCVAALGAGFFWRLLWEWPKGIWIFPLIVATVLGIYGWNMYLFGQMLRMQQQLILAVELGLLFILFVLVLRAIVLGWTVSAKKHICVFASVLVLLFLIINSLNNPLAQPSPGKSVADMAPLKLEYPHPIYVLGIDGADWQVVLPLIKMGKLPSLSCLFRNSAVDYLSTFDPTSSPLIWTTMATGKGPFEHGIRDFGIHVLKPLDSWISVLPKGAGLRKIAAFFQKLGIWEFYPASSAQIQCKTIWQIANDRGVPVSVSNWPVSVPVNPVRGFMTAETDYYLFHGLQPTEAVFPRSFGEDILSGSESPILAQRGPAPDDVLSSSLALVSDSGYRMTQAWHIFQYGCAKWPVPLNLYYTHTLDLTQHLFWQYGLRENGNTQGSGSTFESAYRVIEEQIMAIDAQIAGLFEFLTDQPYILIVSDHGFRTIYLHERLLNPQSERVQGVHDYAPPGLLLLDGPGIHSCYLGQRCSVYDIAPTLLDLLDLPQAMDMTGHTIVPLADSSETRREERPLIPTYETDVIISARSERQACDDAVEQRLKSLGYIE
ncbi:alkaline phosphatase family protein [bacterium]|nr:alkaline phosphatase family protein [bacterium]